jgi:acetate kinase
VSALPTHPLIGVINAGSSSVKFSFLDGERVVLAGQVDGIGVRPSAKAVGPDNKEILPPDLGPSPPKVPGEVLPAIMKWATDKLGGSSIGALGHRVVRGGTHFVPRPASPPNWKC